MPAASAPGSTTPGCPDCGRGSDRLANGAAAPVRGLPKGASVKGVHWTRPALVAELRYAGWTDDKVLRHAAFLGVREDKDAAEIVRETVATDPPAAAAAKPPPAAIAAKPMTAPRARDGSTQLPGSG